jgi:hypothetical protein
MLRATLILVPALATIAGCDAGPRADASTERAAATRPDTPFTVTRTDTLLVVLAAPDEVRPDVPVPLSLRVENTGGKPATLYLRGRAPVLDVVVLDARGDTVWHRLKDEMVQGILALRELAPGETLAVEATWAQRTNDGRPVPPGRYVVRAALLTDTPAGLPAPERVLTVRER